MGLYLRSSSLANSNTGLTIQGTSLSYAQTDGNFMYLLTNMSGSSIKITGSTGIIGNISVSGNLTLGGSFLGTASWADNTLTASFVTASNVYGPYGASSILSASYALSSSYAYSSSYALSASYVVSASRAISSSYALTSSYSNNINGILNRSARFTDTNTISSGSFTDYGTGQVSIAASLADSLIYLENIDGSGNGYGLYSLVLAGTGVYGEAGTGTAVYGSSNSGTGVVADGQNGIGLVASTSTGTALSTNTFDPSGTPAIFKANSVEKIRIDNSGSLLINTTTNEGNKLVVSGSSQFIGNTIITGSVNISSVLTLPPQNPLPSGKPTGSLAVSGSGADCKIYFFNGTWNALF